MSDTTIPRIPADNRLTLLPVGRPDIWRLYKQAVQCHWVPEEISFAEDATHYKTRLTSAKQIFLKHIFAFFAASDTLVNNNLLERFICEIDIPEVRAFYAVQLAMENVHAETYSLQLMVIIPDPEDREHLLNAISTMPIITKLSKFISDTTASAESLGARLLRMCCVEGVIFQGAFCGIYLLQQQGLMPGTGAANELIARDEALHTAGGIGIFKLIAAEHRPTIAEIYTIVDAAVRLGMEFFESALPDDGFPEMNSAMMADYIKSQADSVILDSIGVPRLYNVTHRFHFMNKINLKNKTDFFYRAVTEYAKPTTRDDGDFSVLDSF